MASRRTSCSVATTSSLTLRDAFTRRVALDLVVERLQAEQDRRQRLPGLVVELARQASPLELLRIDDAPQHVARDPLREIHCDGGA